MRKDSRLSPPGDVYVLKQESLETKFRVWTNTDTLLYSQWTISKLYQLPGT